MPALNGQNGAVSLTPTSTSVPIVLHANKWSLSWGRDMVPADQFASTAVQAGWSEFVPGLTKITGSISGYYQDSAEAVMDKTQLNVDDADLVLTAKTGKTFTWTGAITIRDMNFTSGVGELPTWNCTFSANTVPAIA